jgi:hypothetical protein
MTTCRIVNYASTRQRDRVDLWREQVNLMQQLFAETVQISLCLQSVGASQCDEDWIDNRNASESYAVKAMIRSLAL